MDLKIENKTGRIVMDKACGKHSAPRGTYCFSVLTLDGTDYHYGICNDRATKAGFYGQIDPRSLKAGKK